MCKIRYLLIGTLAVNLLMAGCSWNYSGATSGNLSGGSYAQIGAITLHPSSSAYAPRKIGTTSPAHVFTVTNPAGNNGAATITKVETSDSQYAIDAATTSCTGLTLQAGGNCKVGVKFSPTSTGPQNANLTVEDNAANSPQTATLTGSGK